MAKNPYEMLSEPIRRYVRDQRWEQFRPIQSAAITRIISSNDNYVLASRTASGKTEAAFLPILSKVNFKESGVQVLYVSPLIALINDQFKRIEDLCIYLDISVTKWHGEANKGKKNMVLSKPEGVLLITPESLESMITNKPGNIVKLFSNLKYIVIDEIHSFIGNPRGIQLKSLLSRISQLISHKFSVIELSATIGDYNEAKEFTGNPDNTHVLLDRTAKEIKPQFKYFYNDNTDLPLSLIKDLYLETCNNKVLIFPNNRGKSEEIAVKLLKISEKVNGHPNYYSHHSSINRDVREYVEYFVKNNIRQNFVIACTSTLELGIDIGTVDKVVQLDATSSVASLIQRVGRSGRKDNELSNLVFYATGQWSMLQALACWELYKEGIIDPPFVAKLPYDILVHQILSTVKQKSSISQELLVELISLNYAFKYIEKKDLKNIIEHLIKIDILELIQNELIIGIDGEPIINNKNFYGVFKEDEAYKVVNSNSIIGEMPLSESTLIGENLFLGAKIWKIIGIDNRTKRIEVIPAKDGKRPEYFGSRMPVHPIIREKMLQILLIDNKPSYLDERSLIELQELRQYFRQFKLSELSERPILDENIRCSLYTFTGTKINRALSFLLNMAGIKARVSEMSSEINIESTKVNFLYKWKQLESFENKIDDALLKLIRDHPVMMGFTKWGFLLPEKYQILLLKEQYYDFKGAFDFINRINLISTSSHMPLLLADAEGISSKE